MGKGIDRWNCREGAATPPLRSRRRGRALATTSVDSAPTSPLGRLISRTRFRGNAMADARTSDMCRHSRVSTNSSSVPSEIFLARGAVSAATASEA